MSRSHIDVTLVTETISHTVRGWKVLDDYTASLHRYITFTLKSESSSNPLPPKERWAWRKFDRSKLLDFLQNTNAPDKSSSAAVDADAVNKFLGETCDACMPKGTYRGGKKPAFWWTNEIKELRAECLKARRKYKRSRTGATSTDAQEYKQFFKESRKKLKLAIKRSKEASWKKLCAQVERDPWGLPYKIVTKKLVGRRTIPGLTLPGRLNHIVDTLFPKINKIIWQPVGGCCTFPEISCEKIIECSSNITLGKAPGPDGVPDMVVKEVSRFKSEILRSLFSKCLEQGVFPESWKVANLVLLRKGDKPLDNPSSYRPICLLNTVGKLFERIIKQRLEKHPEETDGLSDKQYGFRKGRSTVDAIRKMMEIVDKSSTGPLYKRQLCAVIALDVKNAFNIAKWDRIEEALHAKKIPSYLIRIVQSYLSCRQLLYGNENVKTVTCGVP